MKTFNSKLVGSENGILQNQYRDTVEPNKQPNSEDAAVLCSLLQGSTAIIIFFWLSKGHVQLLKLSIQNILF